MLDEVVVPRTLYRGGSGDLGHCPPLVEPGEADLGGRGDLAGDRIRLGVVVGVDELRQNRQPRVPVEDLLPEVTGGMPRL